MSEQEYIVLRAASTPDVALPGDPDVAPPGDRDVDLETLVRVKPQLFNFTVRDRRRAGPPEVTAMPKQAKLTTAFLNERQAAELSDDPDVLASSISVPISLIRPASTDDEENAKAEAAARAAGASWGVMEVAPNAGPDAGSGVTVAVLDTGIDPNHPAFKVEDLTLKQKNFSKSPKEDDVLGHGTHCAGTIFGRDVEGVRIGIARGVKKALIGKILDDEGSGNTASVARAMQWAQDEGAQVISISLGIEFGALVDLLEKMGKARNEALSRALVAYRDSVRLFDAAVQLLNAKNVVQQRGTLAIAAAGNESRRKDAKPYVMDTSVPAAAIGILSVGAVSKGDKGYEIAEFSNTNPLLCAPGVGIVSAKAGGGLVADSGTSMAAPHVAGAAVLWWERVLRDDKRGGSELVRSNILTSCRTQGFAPGVARADRGIGLVQSPP